MVYVLGIVREAGEGIRMDESYYIAVAFNCAFLFILAIVCKFKNAALAFC